MKRLLWLVGATLGGALGGWIGTPLGFMGQFLLGVIGTAAGVYAANRLARHWLA